MHVKLCISVDIAAMSGNCRQKLNTGSSTEVELVGIDDVLKHIMWGFYFIQAEGYEVTKNILMQDNNSTILMAKNGQFSCSKHTKHIKNRYFIIKVKIGKGGVIIQYSPTGDMWVDINTKALQGSLFYKMRARLMGVDENYDDDIEKQNTHPDPLPQESQECATTVSEETKKMLVKAGAFCKVMAFTQSGLPIATKRTHVAVYALVLKTMAIRTDKSSSHCRRVLGGRGNAIRPRSIRTDRQRR